MKSYNKRGCYRYGGTLKTKSVHGLKTGNHDNPNVLRAMHGGKADGEAGRGRLDRPVRRADGGRISEDSKREAKEQTRRAGDEIIEGAVRGAPGAALTGTGIGGYLGHRRSIRPPGPVGTAIWGAMTGLGGALAGRSAVRHGNRAGDALDEARRIERGQAEPGREDRKDGGSVGKGPLNAKRRDALSNKSFALPGRRYPINDPNHARNALSRVSQHGSPEEKTKVRRAVHKKFPAIGEKD